MDVFLQNKEVNVGTGREQVNQNQEQRGEFMWGISRLLGEGSSNVTVRTGTVGSPSQSSVKQRAAERSSSGRLAKGK